MAESHSDQYTLAQVAERLDPEGGERARYLTAKKIQNWITSGLVRPETAAHSGRGVHRTFDRWEVLKCGVLLELGRYQTSARVPQMLAEMFDESHPRASEWRHPALRDPLPATVRTVGRNRRLITAAAAGKQSIYIKISGDGVEVDSDFPDTVDRSAIIINLGRVLADLF